MSAGRLVINRMQAAIAGAVVTLTKEAGGVSTANPTHLDVTGAGIVITFTTAAAAAEFFEAAAKGRRYTVAITGEG